MPRLPSKPHGYCSSLKQRNADRVSEAADKHDRFSEMSEGKESDMILTILALAGLIASFIYHAVA